MKFIGYEWKKIQNHKLLWGILIVCLIANTVICYINTPVSDYGIYLEQIIEEYKTGQEQVDTYYQELQAIRISEQQNAAEASKNGIPYEIVYPCTYSGDQKINDVMLYDLFYNNILNFDSRYQASVSKIVQNSQNNQIELMETYRLDERDFAYRKQALIEAHYSEMLQRVTVIPEYAKGWDSYVLNETSHWFTLILIALVSAVVFTVEENGSGALIRSTKKGRRETWVGKLTVAIIVGIGIILLFSVSTLLAIALKSGLSSPRQYAVIFEDFLYMPYPLKIYQLVLLSLLSKILVEVLWVAFICFLSTILKKMPILFAAGLLPLIVGYILYVTSEQMVWKFINPYGFYHFVPLLQRYQCFAFYKHLVNFIPFNFVLFSVLFAGVYTVCIVTTNKRFGSIRLKHSKSVLEKLQSRLPKIQNSKKRRSQLHSLFQFESYKQMTSRQFLLLFLVILTLKYGLTVTTYVPQDSFDNALYKEYINQLTELSEENQSVFLKTERAKINDTISAQESQKDLFLEGRITSEEYKIYLDQLVYAKSHNSILEKVEERHEYLENVRHQKGIPADFIYETDWITYLNSGCDYALIILLILTLSGVFADEHSKKNGYEPMATLIKGTKRGRQPLFWTKIQFALVFSTVAFFTFSGADIIYGIKVLDLPSEQSTLVSLNLFQNTDSNITIRTFFVWRYLLRYIGVLSVSTLTLFFGELLRKKTYSICATLIVTFVPHLCVGAGMRFMRWFDIGMLLDGTQLYLYSSAVDQYDFIQIIIFSAVALIIDYLIILALKKLFCNRRKYEL